MRVLRDQGRARSRRLDAHEVTAAGLAPAGRLPVTGSRAIAAVLAVAAVALTAAPRIDPAAGDRTAWLAALVLLALSKDVL